MKKLSKSFRPLAFAMLGAALVSCTTLITTDVIEGGTNGQTISLSADELRSWQEAYPMVDAHCGRYGKS